VKPCVCGCGRYVSPVAVIDGWREQCVVAILLDIRRLQNLAPAALALVASTAHDAGALHLARAMIGSLPYDDSPPYRELMQ
jgi:hypothetical protein